MRPTIKSREGNPDLSNGVQPQVNGAPANVSTDATRVSQLIRLSHYNERTVVRILSAGATYPKVSNAPTRRPCRSHRQSTPANLASPGAPLSLAGVRLVSATGYSSKPPPAHAKHGPYLS